MTFEELLANRDISELSEEEINGIIEKLNTVDLERFQQKIQTEKAAKVRKPSAKAKSRVDMFDQFLLQGKPKAPK